MLASLLIHPQGYGGVICEHPQVGLFVDLLACRQERGGLCVSSTTLAEDLETPPFWEKHYRPGASVGELWSLFQQQLQSFPSESLLPLSADNFVSRFEASYADETDWRNARGGPTEEEVRRIAQRNVKNASDEDIANTLEQQRAMAKAGLAEGLRERFRALVTPEQKLRFRVEDLVIIHDQLDHADLVEIVSDNVEDEEWEVTALPDASLQTLLPEPVRFEKVATLDFPLPTDAYKPPAGTLPLELFPHKKLELDEDC